MRANRSLGLWLIIIGLTSAFASALAVAGPSKPGADAGASTAASAPTTPTMPAAPSPPLVPITRPILTTLSTATSDPIALDIARDGRVFWIERTGAIKVWLPDGATKVVGRLSVFTDNEHGLLGIALDPAFPSKPNVFLYYSPAAGPSENRLSRFTLSDAAGNAPALDPASERVLLRVPTDRATCCHQAGDLEFGPDGKLYLSIGDNTNPFESDGYAPIDGRPGRSYFDSRRSAGNLDDLRGAILRLNPDGSIPADNPYVGSSSARPEIWAKGFRNPFRISIDPDTGYVYVGNVGPDAHTASAARGPAGLDEYEVIKHGGENHGWPYCIGPNLPYRAYDFATGVSGPPFDCGGRVAPLIWYPYDLSKEFPQLGQGGRTAISGPIYHRPQIAGPKALPASFEGKWFILEWSRDWIKTVTLSPDSSRVTAIDDFLDGLRRPIDLKEGPDGALYLVEYGSDWGDNKDSRISRITLATQYVKPPAVYDGKGVGPVTTLVNDGFDGPLDPAVWGIYHNTSDPRLDVANGRLKINHIDGVWHQGGIMLHQPLDLTGKTTTILVDYVAAGFDEQNVGLWAKSDLSGQDVWSSPGVRLQVGATAVHAQLTPELSGNWTGNMQANVRPPYRLEWVLAHRQEGQFDTRLYVNGRLAGSGRLDMGPLDPHALTLYLYVSNNNGIGPATFDRVAVTQQAESQVGWIAGKTAPPDGPSP